MKKLLSWTSVLFAAGLCAQTQHVHTRSPYPVVTRVWKAQWIDAGGDPQGYGVYHFRKSFSLAAVPEHFVVGVSGDNRYQLFVNGKWASAGPARGDLTHWRYETVDLAPLLQAGANVLAAVVWNDGAERAVAQITNQTGFVLEAEDAAHPEVNTGRSWKCSRDAAYTAQPLPDQYRGYHAIGPNERIDGRAYPWGWNTQGFDDDAWAAAHEIGHAAERDTRDAPNRWMLVPRQIPPEERTAEGPMTVREAEGLTLPLNEPVTALQVPAQRKVTVLLDRRYLTTSYPHLVVSGGSGATVELHYAETLFDPPKEGGKRLSKSNRNEVAGKIFFGPFDSYLPDGGDHRVFEPLFWRTYRYLKLQVQTADAPLTIHEIGGMFTGYPFARSATFQAPESSANGEYQRILDTGWRTARLCAHETYMDCPFYEQLQYAGDARIQMLVSLYMTGDARLMKNGIELLNDSRTAEGATYSRAPSQLQQYIPPFSLWWIGMVHDYWMYVDDPEFVREMLPGVRAVLSFYQRYQGVGGSLSRMPWWNFVDWVRAWPNGEAPAEADGSSAAALDLQLLLAYDWAADLEDALGSQALATDDLTAAQELRDFVHNRDWDQSRGLFADQPSHRTYSQHVNTLALLAHVVAGAQAQSVAEKMLGDASLAPASIYFRAYTNAALREAGLGDRYPEMLGPWQHMLSEGLTTWAEWDGDDTRSDCHAWGASPNFEFLRTVAGIEPASPGFHDVRITPHLAEMKHVQATMPHPRGEIRLELEADAGHLKGSVALPEGTPGILHWAGKDHALKPGANRISY